MVPFGQSWTRCLCLASRDRPYSGVVELPTDNGDPPLPTSQSGERPRVIKAVPVRHVGRWVAAVLVIAVAGYVVGTIVTAPNMRWDVVTSYLFYPLILRGILVTLELTALAMAIAIVLGVVLAVMRLSPNPVVSSVSGYISGSSAALQSWFSFSSGTTSTSCFHSSGWAFRGRLFIGR